MNNRQLDVKIAEKVFGAKVTFLDQKAGWRIDYVADCDECNDPIATDYGNDGYRLKRYSSDVKAAWEIIDKMFEDNEWLVDITASRKMGPGMGGVDVTFECKCQVRGRFHAEADELPEAVCLAALKIMEKYNG